MTTIPANSLFEASQFALSINNGAWPLQQATWLSMTHTEERTHGNQASALVAPL